MAELIINGCFCVTAPWYLGGDDKPVISGGVLSHDGEEGDAIQICPGMVVGSATWSLDVVGSALTEDVKLFAGAAGVIATVPSGSVPGSYSGAADITDVGTKQFRLRFVGGGSGAVDNLSLTQ